MTTDDHVVDPMEPGAMVAGSDTVAFD